MLIRRAVMRKYGTKPWNFDLNMRPNQDPGNVSRWTNGNPGGGTDERDEKWTRHWGAERKGWTNERPENGTPGPDNVPAYHWVPGGFRHRYREVTRAPDETIYVCEMKDKFQKMTTIGKDNIEDILCNG